MGQWHGFGYFSAGTSVVRLFSLVEGNIGHVPHAF